MRHERSTREVTMRGDTDLADLELDVLDSARLDSLGGLLNVSLDENDRFGVDTLDPTDHLLRDEFRLDLDETLDRVGLLTENDEDHLGTCNRKDPRNQVLLQLRSEQGAGALP